jgi:hypothetical protein
MSNSLHLNQPPKTLILGVLEKSIAIPIRKVVLEYHGTACWQEVKSRLAISSDIASIASVQLSSKMTMEFMVHFGLPSPPYIFMSAVNPRVGVHLAAKERRAAVSAKGKLPFPTVKTICEDCHGVAVVCV